MKDYLTPTKDEQEFISEYLDCLYNSLKKELQEQLEFMIGSVESITLIIGKHSETIEGRAILGDAHKFKYNFQTKWVGEVI